jgi:hypothetical protein
MVYLNFSRCYTLYVPDPTTRHYIGVLEISLLTLRIALIIFGLLWKGLLKVLRKLTSHNHLLDRTPNRTDRPKPLIAVKKYTPVLENEAMSPTPVTDEEDYYIEHKLKRFTMAHRRPI